MRMQAKTIKWFCVKCFKFVYESEKSKKDVDILKSIQKGAKLRHVRTNDRSKPNLKGITKIFLTL